MREKNKILEYWALGFILVLAELAFFSHLRFSLEFDRIFGRDWPIHLINTFKIFHCHFDISKILLWYETSPNVIYYTPFNYLISAAFWEFLKFPPLAAVYASKAFWILLGSLALYGAGKGLGKSACAGIVATTLGILNGLMLEMAREVSQEFLVPAALAIVIYGYVLSRAYQNLLGSLALGVFLGIGVLSKSSLSIFAAPFLVLGLFLSPFSVKVSFKKRFFNASCAALIALGIASSFYLNFFYRFLKEAIGETDVSFVLENLGKFFSFLFPFIIYPVMLLLAIAAIILQAKKKDPFLIHITLTLIVICAFMITTRSLSSTYLLPMRILFALLIARSFRYISGVIRFVLAMMLIIILYLPLQAGRPLIKSEAINRFLYSYDKWMTSVVIVPRNQGDFDWKNIDILAILLKNRYADYCYKDIGYILACGINHASDIALALVKDKNAWLEYMEPESVILVSLETNSYSKSKLNKMRSKKLIIFSLPKQTTGEPYELLHGIFNALESERNVDFSFPMRWDLFLPGDFKIMFLTEKHGP